MFNFRRTENSYRGRDIRNKVRGKGQAYRVPGGQGVGMLRGPKGRPWGQERYLGDPMGPSHWIDESSDDSEAYMPVNK